MEEFTSYIKVIFTVKDEKGTESKKGTIYKFDLSDSDSWIAEPIASLGLKYNYNDLKITFMNNVLTKEYNIGDYTNYKESSENIEKVIGLYKQEYEKL